jgi:hypothetical protein
MVAGDRTDRSCRLPREEPARREESTRIESKDRWLISDEQVNRAVNRASSLSCKGDDLGGRPNRFGPQHQIVLSNSYPTGSNFCTASPPLVRLPRSLSAARAACLSASLLRSPSCHAAVHPPPVSPSLNLHGPQMLLTEHPNFYPRTIASHAAPRGLETPFSPSTAAL